MRNVVAVLLCACSLAACRPREDVSKTVSQRVHTTIIPENEAKKEIRDVIHPIPATIDKVLLGADLGPDGAVSQETDHFERGQIPHLTLRLRDSPVGLKTSARWFAGKKELLVEQKEMNGGKLATFALPQKLLPGKYHVQGYWGGNLVGDKTFEVK
jgi:hypothetical protein